MGSWPARVTKDSPKDEDAMMKSFETTGRTVGIQTAVRHKSKSTVQLMMDDLFFILYGYAYFKADCQK